MRLLAIVEIYNLEYSSYYHKPIHQKCKSKLTIGKKRPQDAHPILVISSNYNKTGTNYQIHLNIIRTFRNRSSQGLTTIRFQSPNHDVLISKADPIQLKAFLNVLIASSMAKSNDSNNNNKQYNDLKYSTLTPFSNNEVAKTKLKILNRLDYPITTNFPFSLTHLSINNIQMSKIDLRIFKLKHLQRLDISDNKLKELPGDGWDGLVSLVELNLSSNNISRLPEAFCCSQLAATLRKLDLSRNQMAVLPWKISRFESLIELHLKHNLLTKIPDSLARLKSLQTLDFSNNAIYFLPGDFLYMRLHLLVVTFQNKNADVTNTNYDSSTNDTISFPPSLYESSARYILNNKLEYTDADRLTQAYLDTHKKCSVCTKACFESAMATRQMMNLTSISTFIVRDRDIPINMLACSLKCYDKLTRNALVL